jgi:predicted SnoaL-like aldol condensation-catalyzing enzyme
MEEGVLVEHWDVIQDEQGVRNPRVGIRCSAVHSPDR